MSVFGGGKLGVVLVASLCLPFVAGAIHSVRLVSRCRKNNVKKPHSPFVFVIAAVVMILAFTNS